MKTKIGRPNPIATALGAVLSLGLFLTQTTFGQNENPYPTPPPESDVPISGDIWRYTVPPSPLQGGLDIPSPTPQVSFQALADDNTWFPADTHGAVGPGHVLTMLNTQVRIQTRTGSNIAGPVSLSNWWTTAGATFSKQVFDPKVMYDPYADRWIATALTDPQVGTASLLLATSQTGNPTNAWDFFQVDADPNNVVWADYPSLGFNRQWITVSVNMFTNSGNFRNSRLYVFDRPNVYAGGTNFVVINAETNDNVFTVVPAVTYDTNLSTLFLVHRHIGLRTNELGETEGLIRLRTLTGAVNSPVLSTNEVFAGQTPWAWWPGVWNIAPQTNSAVKIMNNDARIQQVVYRNGSVWVTHTIFLPSVNPTHSAVQWWQLATNGLVRQVGRIEDESAVDFYAFPSIAVNRFNDVLLGFSSFSTNQYASGNYAFRTYYDPSGEFRLPALLKAGEGAYYKGGSRNRWGDYSATQPDPVNDASFWTIQEYALPYVGTLTNGSGRWATWWGQIAVTNPPNDNFGNSIALLISQLHRLHFWHQKKTAPTPGLL
jgi:hypothetical protein